LIVREPLPEWPLFGMTGDVRPTLRQVREAGLPCTLATLIAVEGGGPRPEGTQMVFAHRTEKSGGYVAGYFSGGCVESDVADHAFACLADGEPRTLVYGEGSPWPDIQLLCGARIEIFLERVAADDDALAELLSAHAERRPVVWVSDGYTRKCAEELSPWPEAAVVRRHEPTPRLIVVGGDPTALTIAQLGAQSEFETTLVRPKGPAAGPPIANVGYSRAEPHEAFAAIGVDPWTAIAIATHDLETDRAALRAALPSAASYVGLLGARRRIADRLAPLRAEGAPEHLFEKLRAPIGLDIGGKAPWEVAVSVIGEIMALNYARESGSTSTTLPAAAAPAPANRRISASDMAKTLTSEES
jgi:xanthine dehydrogenase accessory factor